MTNPATISQGASGLVVRWLQYRLVRRTLSDNQIDGIFGPVTKRAVEELQKDSNLGVDGIVGPTTWSALGGDGAEPRTLAEGSRGTVVEKLQNALNEGRGGFAPRGRSLRRPGTRMTLRPARTLTAFVCATAVATLALETAVLGVSGAAAPPTFASLGRCSTSDLAVSVTGRGGGSAGSYYFHIDFRNVSHQSCRISGYPGVSAVDAHGRRMGLPVGREVHGHVDTVTLRPGRHTSAILHATDVGVLPPSSCRPATPAGLRVYPPDDTASRLVRFHYPVCAATGSMRVRAVKTEAGF